MVKQLTEEQKIKIDEHLYGDKGTPGDVTIGDEITKLLNLSKEETAELDCAIEQHVVDFFQNPSARFDRIRRMARQKGK